MSRADLLEGAPPADVSMCLAALPLGSFTASVQGTRWLLTRSCQAQGRVQNLVGHALDGSDRISFNLYQTAQGWRLRPCEMPAAKVIGILRALSPLDDQ